MRGATPPISQYTFIAWCSVKHGALEYKARGRRDPGTLEEKERATESTAA